MRDVNAEIITSAFRRIIFNNVLHSSALNAVLILEPPAVWEAGQSGIHTERCSQVFLTQRGPAAHGEGGVQSLLIWVLKHKVQGHTAGGSLPFHEDDSQSWGAGRTERVVGSWGNRRKKL